MLKKLIKEYFFLRKGERRALIIISLILVVSVSLRVMVGMRSYPELQPDPEYVEFMKSIRAGLREDSLRYAEECRQKNLIDRQASEKQAQGLSLFSFDPNTISEDSLLGMHIPEKVVRNMIRYREAGGTFRKKEALEKIYGMTPALYDSLQRYLCIVSDPKALKYADSLSGARKVREEISLMLNLNAADTAALWNLPGIGLSYARRIVKYREMLGGYSCVGQLLEVYGMDSMRYQMIEDHVFIDSSLLLKVDLNEVDFKDLIAHPYVSREMCYAVMQYREYRGEITAIDELEKNQIIDHESFKRLKPYLEVKINKD